MNILQEDEISEREITGTDFSEMDLSGRIFENCVFKHCVFINTKLKNTKFEKITFESCNISNVDLTQSAVFNTEFLDSKIVGLSLFKCKNSIFDLVFKNSKLEYCNFSDIHMKKNVFDRCEIIESYFQNTFLPQARFLHSTFIKTQFIRCDLTKADFSGSDGYSIDPRDCKVKQAIFSLPGALGLLDMFEIKIQ